MTWGPLLQNPRPQILDSNGDPLASGSIEFYEVGTTTPKNVYSDVTLDTSIGADIALDASGRPSTDVYLDGAYKMVVKDSADATVYTVAEINNANAIGVELSSDTSPQLGGDLDVQTNKIVSTGNNDIELEPNSSGSGKVILDGPVDVGNGTDTVKIGNVTFPNSGTTVGQILKITSSNTAAFADNTFTLPLKFISGLHISNAADTDHDISITTGAARSANGNEVNISLGTAITKQIDASWSAGNNAGGFPSALSLSADTTYHVFVIEDGAGTVDAGFDTSLTATNLLSDSSYTNYRRVGSVVTDSSSNIINFVQRGDTYLYDTPIRDVNAGALATAETLRALSVPTGIKVEAIINCRQSDGTGDDTVIYDPDQTAGAASLTAAPLVNLEASTAAQLRIMTDTSGQVADRSTGGGSATLYIVTVGYRDFREED